MNMLIRFLADGTLILILAVASYFVLKSLRLQWWRNVPLVVMAGLTSLLTGKLLSLLYQPGVARPFLEVGLEPGAAYIDNPGFPSDHALLATAAVVAVYALTRNKPVGIVLATLVVVMGVGRVIALVHTPIDVIGGVIAGLAGAFWYMKLTK